MKEFALGFLIAFFFEPISEILSYIVEWIRSDVAVRIAANNAKIAELSSEAQQEEEYQITRAIGFTIPDDNQGELEEDEE